MKTKITYKSGADVLRLDDTDHETFPVEGEKIEINGVDYTVRSIESAVVILDPIPEEDQVKSPTRAQGRAHVQQRLKDEAKASRRSDAPRGSVRPAVVSSRSSATRSTRATASRRAATNLKAPPVHSTTSKHVAAPARSHSKGKR